MRTFLIVSFLLTLSFNPAIAAEMQGEPGALVGFREVGANSDNHSIVRGSIWVAEPGHVQPYYWGGSLCVSKNLTEQETVALAGNLDNPQIRIIPVYKNGQLPGTRCLIEYILIDRKYVGDADPFPFDPLVEATTLNRTHNLKQPHTKKALAELFSQGLLYRHREVLNSLPLSVQGPRPGSVLIFQQNV